MRVYLPLLWEANFQKNIRVSKYVGTHFCLKVFTVQQVALILLFTHVGE